MINENKIAFITCVNDALEYREALNYIERLDVPKGYEIDTIAVQEAHSMAEGYQAAMESCEAKYKIYMHQDVFICNKHFIEDIIKLFQSDDRIGMIGMVGRTQLPEKLVVAADWDIGNIHFNGGNIELNPVNSKEYTDVEAVDGLLIATQYDLTWRYDLFDGWDFYDISQCQEFIRNGYKIVVPYQSKNWCDHDNTYSKLGKYFYYQTVFCEEYQDIKKFTNSVLKNSYVELEQNVWELYRGMELLVDKGKKQELWNLFVKMRGKVHLGLQEFYLLSQIDRLERNGNSGNIFWESGLSWLQLRNKIRSLKFKLKRLEYDVSDQEEVNRLYENCSAYAMAVVALTYVADKEEYIKKIKKWHYVNNMQDMWKIWEGILKEKGLI